MNRLHILLTVMVVVVGALFAAQEALAMVLTGTGGEDRLIGTGRIDRLTGLAGEDNLKGNSDNYRIWGGQGNDKIIPSDRLPSRRCQQLLLRRQPRMCPSQVRLWPRPWRPRR
jgi:hypothetical protein